jgi:hypothetical protein
MSLFYLTEISLCMKSPIMSQYLKILGFNLDTSQVKKQPPNLTRS